MSSQAVLYGPETARAKEYLNLCPVTLVKYPQILTAMGQVKKACAMANREAGALDARRADAIITACDAMIAGQFTDQFPLCAIGGMGAILNTTANEVLAARANQILGADEVDALDHVNMSQSANDVLRTARILAVHDAIGVLLDGFPYLENPLAAKAGAFKDVVKMGRTSYRDAVPLTLGQEFSGYHSQIRRNRLRLEEERRRWNRVPLGATVLGTGLGCKPGYFDIVCEKLSAVCGRTIVRADNLFDAMQTADAYVLLHAHIQCLALCAAKIAQDIRLMASGPRAGWREITLRALQPGSSIMPGKINPVVPHMVMQISQRISANHAGIALAASSGEMDLGSSSSVVFKGLIDSMELIRKGMRIFGEKVVDGIGAQEERCRTLAERSLGLSAVVNALFGHQAASDVARLARDKDITIKEAAIRSGLLGQAEADRAFDLPALTDVAQSQAMLAALASGQA